jgi:hypothetical protein
MRSPRSCRGCFYANCLAVGRRKFARSVDPRQSRRSRSQDDRRRHRNLACWVSGGSGGPHKTRGVSEASAAQRRHYGLRYHSSIALRRSSDRPNLGLSGQPEPFVANAVPKLSSLIRPIPFFQTVSGTGLSGKREAPPLTLRPLRGALWTVAFPTPVNATTDERNDDMKPTRYTNEAELKALFDHAVRAIGFYEAQRKGSPHSS